MASLLGKVKKILDDLVSEIIVAIIIGTLGGFVALIKNVANIEYLLKLYDILLIIVFVLIYVLIVAALLTRLDRIKEMRKRRRIYKNLSEYIKNTDAIKSIQFYEYTKLPEPCDCVDDDITIQVSRIGGVTDKSFDTNCIMRDSCTLSTAFYQTYCYDAFNIIQRIEDSLLNSQDVNYRYIDTDLKKLEKYCKEIKDKYLTLSSINEIKTQHYYYYRILWVLSEKGYYFTQIVKKHLYNMNIEDVDNECVWLLGKEKRPIEEVLKLGKRSQYYGAFITNQSYCFMHEPNSLKEGRNYFSSRFCVSDKKNELLMVVTYDVGAFATVTKEATTFKCDAVRDEIAAIVNGKKRKIENAKQQ